MLYLVGGPVRVGKSSLARLALQRKQISSITTDALTTSIGRNIPETRLAGSYIPQEEWEQNFYPFLRRFIKTINYDYDDFLIEGAPISPAIVTKLATKFELRAVFVGNSQQSIENLMAHLGNNIWLRNVSPEDLAKIPGRIIARSIELEQSCTEYNYAYVDLAGNFNQKIEDAYNCLFESSE
jgi:hypothetical protein